jgi:hypothetical protein
MLTVLAVALEAGARLYDRVRGSPFDGARSREKVKTLSTGLQAPWRSPGSPIAGTASEPTESLNPYTGWLPVEAQARIADDLDGYRRAEAKDVYDVCLLGGSSAAAFADRSGEELVRAIARDPRVAGREVRLRRYAIEDFKQPQPARLLAFLFSLGHRPEAVIEIDGVAEAGVGWENAVTGTSLLYPEAARWAAHTVGLRYDWESVRLLHVLHAARSEASGRCERFLRLGLWRSALLDHAASLGLAASLARIRAAEDGITEYLERRPREAESTGPRRSDGSGEPESAEEIVRALAEAWTEAAFDMHALCSEREVAYLHVLEPPPESAGTSVSTRSEGIQLAYPALREAGKRLVERGVALLDAAGGLDPLAISAALPVR